MGAIVTAQYIIGANSRLTREQVDKIIEVLDIRNEEGHPIKPPVGRNCRYVLILEKPIQHVPMADGDYSS
jgi:hypothetical protein